MTQAVPAHSACRRLFWEASCQTWDHNSIHFTSGHTSLQWRGYHGCWCMLWAWRNSGQIQQKLHCHPNPILIPVFQEKIPSFYCCLKETITASAKDYFIIPPQDSSWDQEFAVYGSGYSRNCLLRDGLWSDDFALQRKKPEEIDKFCTSSYLWWKLLSLLTVAVLFT